MNHVQNCILAHRRHSAITRQEMPNVHALKMQNHTPFPVQEYPRRPSFSCDGIVDHRHAFLPGMKLDRTLPPATTPEFSFSRLLPLTLLNLTAARSLTLIPLE